MSLLDLVARHKAGEIVGVTSVCSAHPLAIEAAAAHASKRGAPVALIEATSNQVNQEGGYTGMRPQDFVAFARKIAVGAGLDEQRLAFGGDHLGPNVWRREPAAAAMAKAEAMVAEYAAAGIGKLHLDCSMACADDPLPLDEQTIAERAARLCAAAERAAPASADAPLYVIGTEVPTPGGAHEDLKELAVTSPAAVAETVALHKRAFLARGLGDAWSRVIAVVAQPGVEFDHDKVIDYRPEKARALRRFSEGAEGLVFEAHSTDYQTRGALRALVRDHFAILKVGPGLTFALREALLALDAIEREWFGDDASGFRGVCLETMLEDPVHWRGYYREDADETRLAADLFHSLSDRIRYYWPSPKIEAARRLMFDNLDRRPPPLAMISQHLPAAYEALREGKIERNCKAMTIAHLFRALDPYADACAPQGNGRP